MALGDLIASHKLLIEWYDAAADYADNNRGNNRRRFDTAIARANRLFTAAFTDEAIPVFETAGIINNANFPRVLNAIRGRNPKTPERIEQQEMLVAEYLDDPVTPKQRRPERGDAFAEAGKYLKDTNPKANEQAFISHVAKAHGITRKEARAFLADSIKALEDLNVINSTYSEFAIAAPDIAAYRESLGLVSIDVPLPPFPPILP